MTVENVRACLGVSLASRLLEVVADMKMVLSKDSEEGLRDSAASGACVNDA